jgi:hypothetical protein
MIDEKDTSREDQALDALIVAAFLQGTCGAEDLEKQSKRLESALSAEDRKALESLGPDLVRRIMADEWAPVKQEQESANQEEFRCAMNRGDQDTELTDKAREEMERRIRESESEENEHPENPEDNLD